MARPISRISFIISLLSASLATAQPPVATTLAVQDALTNRCTFGYTALGPVKTLKNALGNVVSHLFDTSYRRTAVVDPTAARTSFGYSSAACVTNVKNPLGQVTTTLPMPPLDTAAVGRHSHQRQFRVRRPPC